MTNHKKPKRLKQKFYTTNGKETSDETEVGLYLWDVKPKNEMHAEGKVKLWLKIPPGEMEHVVRTEKIFVDRTCTLTGLQ